MSHLKVHIQRRREGVVVVLDGHEHVVSPAFALRWVDSALRAFDLEVRHCHQRQRKLES